MVTVEQQEPIGPKDLGTQAGPPTGLRGSAILRTIRPSQWIKNLFVLAPLPFSERRADPAAWALVFAAFVGFCLISSVIYIINDVVDRKSDRTHPTKRFRPIASGQLSIPLALTWAAMLLLISAVIFVTVASYTRRLSGAAMPLEGLWLPIWAAAYIALNLAYSLRLKMRPILDVILIATGFVLRALAGAAAIAVPASPWLVVCTFMLCLFIALAKRRSEIVELGNAAQQTRRVNQFYTVNNLDHMLSVSAGLAILTYTMYCLAPRTVEHLGSQYMVFTVPFVVYGMFRFYCLTLQSGGQDPSLLLLRDKMMWLVGAAWLLCVSAIIHWGHLHALSGVLQ